MSDSIGAIYRRALGRDASASDVQYWQGYLNGGGSLAGMLNAVVHSDEERGAINSLYRQVLGRDVDEGGLGYWENQSLMQGGSLSDVRRYLGYSDEAHYYVSVMYQQIWARYATQGECGYWQGRLSVGDITLQGVRNAMAYATDAAWQINSIYAKDIGRYATANELSARQAELSAGVSLNTLDWNLVHSDYERSAINDVYVQTVGRGVEASVIDYWIGAELSHGGSINDLRHVVAYSDEAHYDIGVMYQQIWARDATAGDYGYWQGRLAAGNITLQGIRTAMAYATDAAWQINSIYAKDIGRYATASELSTRQAELSAGVGLNTLDWNLIHSVYESAAIDDVYEQTLGRKADDGGKGYWVNYLSSGHSINDVRQALASSDEARSQIATAFRQELGREATAADYAFWQARLANASATYQGIRSTFAYSDETTTFIQNVFAKDIGRYATADELAAKRSGLIQGTITLGQVDYSLVHSELGRTALNDVYLQSLGRAVDQGGLSYSRDLLDRGRSINDVRQWVSHSQEAADRVGDMFLQVLGRAVDSSGLSFFEDALAHGQSLQDVRYSLAYSHEAQTKIQAVYTQVLGRDATSPEIMAYESALGAGGGRTLALLRWEVSHGVDAERMLRGMYEQLLGRGADAIGLRFYEDSLAAGTTRDGVRLSIAHTPEAGIDFDAAFYLAQNPDVATAGVDPYLHYIDSGWKEGRNPNALFNTNYYLDQNPDVADAGVNPLVHFRSVGWKEGRDPSLAFNTRAYLTANPDVAAAGIDPLRHYLGWGQREGRARVAATPKPFAYTTTAVRAIRAFYLTTLNRVADAGGTAYYQSLLAQGKSLSDVRVALAYSDEAANDIKAYYQLVLNRSADGDSGVAYHQSLLAQGRSLTQLRTDLAHSTEAANDIAYLFRTELGREAQGFDFNYWENRLSTDMSLVAVRGALAYSEDAWSQIGRMYQSVLGRDASATEYAARQADLNGGASLDDIRWYLTQTNEAVADIQSLYVQVLGRLGAGNEIFDWQIALATDQSLSGLRAAFAGSPEAAASIQAIFHKVLGRDASANEVGAYQQALSSNKGWTMALIGPAVATSAINGFYQQMLERDATAAEQAAFKGALSAGQNLTSQFNGMRTAFTTGDGYSYYSQYFDYFYQVNVGRHVFGNELADILTGLRAGQSIAWIKDQLTPQTTRDIQTAYRRDLGHEADANGLFYWVNQIAAGRSIGQVNFDIAHSQEATNHVQALFQASFGRGARRVEVDGYENGEGTSAAADARYVVRSGSGAELGTADARTLVVEAAAYIGLSGGAAPTLTNQATGQVITFRNGYEFAAYALGLANKAGQASASLMQIYNLAVSWMDQVGQADIQAAITLHNRAVASAAAGRNLDAYLESIGAQLAVDIQRQVPSERGPASISVVVGQYLATVTITGDADDTSGCAGYHYTLADADPDRTRLIAMATSEVGLAAEHAAAGLELLGFVDNAQARVHVAYAALAPNVRSDPNSKVVRMLRVAQQFIDTAYQKAADNDWGLVQTLEVAADISLQIAAQPESSQHRLTERYMRFGVKHDITVDPSAADPFASFSDHSKGKDAIGAIVEAVVGVVINILAVIPVTAPVFAPLAVAWDTAQAAKNFSQGNVLGGFLSLASAVGVGLSGLGAIAAGGAAEGAGNFAIGAADLANGAAKSLGFVSTTATIGGITITGEAAAAANLGAKIAQGVTLVGGAAGIVQNANRGDALGIAASLLQVSAAIAGGLISTDAIGGNQALRDIAESIQAGANYTATALSVADAFRNGDLAGGLATSLNALFSQVAQRIGEQFTTPQFESAATVPVSSENLPIGNDPSIFQNDLILSSFGTAPPPFDNQSQGVIGARYDEAYRRIETTISEAPYYLLNPIPNGVDYYDGPYRLIYRIATAQPSDLPQIYKDIREVYLEPGAVLEGNKLIRLAGDAAELGTSVQYRQEILNELASIAKYDPLDLALQYRSAASLLAFPGSMKPTEFQPAYRARTFQSTDPLVGELATKIEAIYPDRVQAIGRNIYRPDGSLLTDLDIVLDNVIIQVKSGSGTGFTKQMLNTRASQGGRVIAYGPELGPTVVRRMKLEGFEVYRTESELLNAIVKAR